MTIDQATKAMDAEEIAHLRLEITAQAACICNWIRNTHAFLKELDRILPGACDEVAEEGEFGPKLAEWIGARIEGIIAARLMATEDEADDSP